MTENKGHILPFFIPHLGCPCRCVFCDQRQISGVAAQPTVGEINTAIEKLCAPAELAFYGGSFTALPFEVQEKYLAAAAQTLEEGKISGIRVSTRPDAIDAERIALLKRFNVRTVELGVQSMDDNVLAQSHRGHTSADCINVVRELQAEGFKVGVQLMPGLPGSTLEKDLQGANTILSLRPDMLRIYPVVVIAGTELAEMFKNGSYKALEMADAIARAAGILAVAEYYGTETIRIGLNPTEDLSRQVLAGAYHPALGNMVKSALFKAHMLQLLDMDENNRSQFDKFVVHKSMLSQAFGHDGCNKAALQSVLGGQPLKISGKGEDTHLVELVRRDGTKSALSRSEFIKLYVERMQKTLPTSC